MSMNCTLLICFLALFIFNVSDATCSHYNLANGCLCPLNETRANSEKWNIVVLVDSTIGSISVDGFEAVRAYVLAYVASFHIAADFSRVSICQMFYSRTSCLSNISSAQDQTVGRISQIVQSMAAQYDGGMNQTNVEAAICVASDQYDDYENYRNATSIVLLISASSLRPGPQTQLAFACLKELRSNSVTVITVAVSSSPLDRSVDLSAVANAGYEINACTYQELDRSIPRRLSCEAAKQCHNPADSTYATSPAPTTPAYPKNSPRPCSCTPEKLWLDVIIAIDVSVKMQNFLDRVTAQLATFFHRMSIRQDKHCTRVALITYASESNITVYLDTLHNFDALNETLRHIHVFNDGSFTNNVRAAFADCIKIWSTANTGGNDRKTYFLLITTAIPSDSVNDIRDVLCANDVTISVMFVDVTDDGIGPPAIYSNIICKQGSILLQFNNFDEEKLYQSLCQKNCYCPIFNKNSSPREDPQQVAYENGTMTGECVFTSAVSSRQTWINAVEFCRLIAQNYSSFIVDVLSEAKDAFLKTSYVQKYGLVDHTGVPSYWIGLNKFVDSGNYTWKQAATNLWASPSDYSNWDTSYPNLQLGACTVSRKTTGFVMKWTSARCDDLSASYPVIRTISAIESSVQLNKQCSYDTYSSSKVLSSYSYLSKTYVIIRLSA